MRTFDAIIVGAGPAGSAAAHDLAAAGLRVLLLDRKRFPRVKPCAGALSIKALNRLRYSIAPVIRCVVRNLAVSVDRRSTRPLTSDHPIAVMTVRQDFDAYCLEQTLSRGAQFEHATDLSDIVQSEDGITLTVDRSEKLSCRYLIGADGANSRVRRLIGGEPVSTALALEGLVCRNPSGARAPMRFDFGYVPGGYGWVFPKGDHLNVGLYAQRRRGTPISRSALLDYARRVAGTDRVEQLIGYPIGIGGEIYRPTHPRIFLVGDAAGMTERLLGEGIHNAIASGQAAAEAIAAAGAHPTAARNRFLRNLEPVQRDLVACTRAARWFYDFRFLGLGRLFPVPRSGALMRGFANGMTFREIMSSWRSPRSGSPPASPAIVEFERTRAHREAVQTESTAMPPGRSHRDMIAPRL